MNAKVVVAVDGPNVHQVLKHFHGANARLNFARLLNYLQNDSQQRLRGSPADWDATVFMQGQALNTRTEESQTSRQNFVDYLSHAGWSVIEKDAQDEYPYGLIDAHRMLREALTTPAEQTWLTVRNAQNRNTRHDAVLREATADLRVYRDLFRRRRWLILRLRLSVLVVLMRRWGVARKSLVKVLLRVYSTVAKTQMAQNSYLDGIRSALQYYLENFADEASSLGVALDPLSDIADLDRDELLSLAQEVKTKQQKYLKEMRQDRDVDALLSEWVREQIKPDPTAPAHLPAVVYLVGNDYRCFLPLAERMKRYGALPVIVTLRDQYESANARTALAVASYELVWLDDFIDHTDKPSLVA